MTERLTAHQEPISSENPDKYKEAMNNELEALKENNTL